MCSRDHDKTASQIRIRRLAENLPRGTSRRYSVTSTPTRLTRCGSVTPPRSWPPPLPYPACYLPGRNAQYCSRNPLFLRLTWSAAPPHGRKTGARVSMIPPTASRDHADAGTDLPARTQHRYGLRWPAILLAATALGMISSAVAWPFTLAPG